MRSFEVPDVGPDEFIERVRQALSGRELERMVSLEHRGDELVVRFSRLGTSELRYALEETGDGFRAELVHEQVAFLHIAFQRTFEEHFESVIARVGGRVA